MEILLQLILILQIRLIIREHGIVLRPLLMGTGVDTWPTGDPHTFDINLSNVDLSFASNFPKYKANNSIVADKYYLVSGYIRIWVPLSDYKCETSSCANNVTTENVLSTYTLNGNLSDSLTNNTASYGLLYQESDPGQFCDFIHSIEMKNDNGSGSAKVMPGDKIVASATLLAADKFGGLNGDGQLLMTRNTLCFKIDNTKSSFTGNFVSNTVSDYQSHGSNWFPDYLWNRLALYPPQNKANVVFVNSNPFVPRNAIVQYSTEPITDINADTCGTYGDNVTEGGTGGWTETFPVGNPASVTRMRVVSTYDANYGNDGGISATGESELIIRPELQISASPSGTKIPLFVGYSYNGGQNWLSTSASTNPADSNFSFSTFVGGCGSGPSTTDPTRGLVNFTDMQKGSANYVTVPSARIRILKENTDQPSNTQSLYEPGSTANFKLISNLEFPSPQPGVTTVIIKDTRDKFTNYF